MQAGNHTAVFQIRQPAEVNNEFRPAVSLRELIARLFDIAVSESQPLSNSAKMGTRKQFTATPKKR